MSLHVAAKQKQKEMSPIESKWSAGWDKLCIGKNS
jgi:hypothetical protein